MSIVNNRRDLDREQAREAVAMYQEEREKNRQHEATIHQLESVLADVTDLVAPSVLRGNGLREKIRHALGINDG